MKNEIALKVYEVDYSFIIKNYLDKSLWNKEWALFIYKDYVFNLSLSKIDIKSNSIVFEISSNQETGYDWFDLGYYPSEIEITYNLNNSNLSVLKKQINGAILKLIINAEMVLIVASEEYKQVKSFKQKEENLLIDIAAEHLDKNNIMNKDIREAYIKGYINKNSRLRDTLEEYKYHKNYTVISDVYLAFLEAIKDKKKKQEVLIALAEKEAENILKEVTEYMEQLQTEEKQKELERELENI